MTKTLVILRGVSGAGKSTVAEMFSEDGRWPVCEADNYHYKKGVYDWKPENLQASHGWCQDLVASHLREGVQKVIVSNTSVSERNLFPYLELAEKYGYRIVSLVVENRHGGGSIHNVPQSTRDTQEKVLRNNIKLQ